MRDIIRPYYGKLVYVHRLVHIDNVPHILANGLVHPNSKNADPSYVPIGDQAIISIRKELHNGYTLSDYIPFYFGPRGPMLYVIHKGLNDVHPYPQEELVYILIKIETVIEQGWECIFTDGHAITAITSYYRKDDLSRVNELVKAEDVYAKYWKDDDDLDLTRRKQAELLIKDEIPFIFIAGFFVYNENARDKLIKMGVNHNRIIVEPRYYF